MKLLLMSDTHGQTKRLEQTIQRHEKEVDLILYAGDSELEDQDPIFQKIMGVAGNCDFPSEQKPKERVIKKEGETIFLSHGHQAQVNFGLLSLDLLAAEKGAQIVVYGHTHVPFVQYDEKSDRLIINPGSLEFPRNLPPKASYAIVEVTPEQHKISWYSASGEEKQTFTYTRKNNVQ